MIIYFKIYCALGKPKDARKLLSWSVIIYLEIFSWKEHGWCVEHTVIHIIYQNTQNIDKILYQIKSDRRIQKRCICEVVSIFLIPRHFCVFIFWEQLLISLNLQVKFKFPISWHTKTPFLTAPFCLLILIY